MDPLISIIIPVYKVEYYLRKCLESVLSQTYRNLEIIIVDDGSPDNCPRICDEYASIDPRIIVIHKENGGQSSARNAALDIAKGEYIAFVDSDDYIEPNYIKELYFRIIKDKSDIAVCDYSIISTKGKKIEKKYMKSSSVIDERQFCDLESNKYYFFAIAFWNKLFKSNIWDNIRLKEGKYAEDSFAMTEYIKKVKKISIVNMPLYNYVQRDESAVHSFSKKNLDAIEARLERCNYYYSLEYFNNIKGSLFQCLNIFAQALLNLDMKDVSIQKRYDSLRIMYQKMFLKVYNGFGVDRYRFSCSLFFYSDKTYLYYYLMKNRIKAFLKCIINSFRV